MLLALCQNERSPTFTLTLAKLLHTTNPRCRGGRSPKRGEAASIAETFVVSRFR
ncbi:MAG TPA: hypothetical protein VK211_24140 [Kamptonema sp.]|nr:hypothetical protein [Kamptonema sp.]